MSNDIWLVGTVVFLMVVVIANMKVVVETVMITSIVYFGLFVSFFAWLAMQLILDGGGGSVTSMTSKELMGSTARILSNGPCWLTIIATLIVACIRDWQWKSIDKIRGGELSMLHAVQDEMLLRKTGQWKESQSAPPVEVIDVQVDDLVGPKGGA